MTWESKPPSGKEDDMSLSVVLNAELIEPGQLREELVSKIADTLNEMPELMRSVIVLNRYQGRSLIQISDQTRLTEADVDLLLRSADQRLYRGLRPLRAAQRWSAGSGLKNPN
jgi:DNA-directed RNA polymerase specialized sigma24 family protein